MKPKILILGVVMLLGIRCLCFAETRKRQRVDIDESPAEVEIYITDWCPYCVKAIRFLQVHGIDYGGMLKSC